jgi:hypothetical protein
MQAVPLMMHVSSAPGTIQHSRLQNATGHFREHWDGFGPIHLAPPLLHCVLELDKLLIALYD